MHAYAVGQGRERIEMLWQGALGCLNEPAGRLRESTEHQQTDSVQFAESKSATHGSLMERKTGETKC